MVQCRQCGGPMMSETVIKLRRGWFGFRETRSQGAYCATCKIGVLIEPQRPALVAGRSDRSIRRLLPSRPSIGVSQSCGRHTGMLSFYDRLFMANQAPQ